MSSEPNPRRSEPARLPQASEVPHLIGRHGVAGTPEQLSQIDKRLPDHEAVADRTTQLRARNQSPRYPSATR